MVPRLPAARAGGWPTAPAGYRLLRALPARSMDQRNRPHSDERIDPDDLETTLRVIGELDRLPTEHPDSITVQQAAA
ncbi:MAG: hypothetical protein IT199_05130, partial [Solirubrobacterales bacterium]|nr:hypothetical protein [Solirubrobacterales bacterium]